MIRPDVLAKARLGGINFHDGPLPRYAGLYVTAWALMNRETSHGVTWHVETLVQSPGASPQSSTPAWTKLSPQVANLHAMQASVVSWLPSSQSSPAS